MSLRVRLIVAFFLFSVVPLAAVTFYSYTSNLRALHLAAQQETQLLTGELTQRMQVVTAQISERVQDLMDMPVAAATGTSGSQPSAARTVARSERKPALDAPAAPAPPAAPAAPASIEAAALVDPRAIEAQVAGALGEVAMLLNNVEVRGMGRPGSRNPRGTPPPPWPGQAPLPSRPVQQSGRPEGAPIRDTETAGPAGPSPNLSGRQGNDPRGRRRLEGRGLAAGTPDANPDPNPDVNLDPSHIKIDLAPIRRELFRELTSGEALEQMTPEQRQRVGREVNQRLLGIVQGMKLSAAEVQKKAEAARQQAAADTAAADARVGAQVRTSPPASPPRGADPLASPLPAPPPVAPLPPGNATANVPPAPAAASAARSARVPATPERPGQPERRVQPDRRETATPRERPQAPTTKKTALTGTKLNVQIQRDGEVLQQVDAEINLPNLLATVFANTKRDSGEIPFAVGRDGQLYAPTDADRARLATLDVSRIDDTPGTKRVDDWVVVTMPDRSGAGLRFGIARPVGNLLKDLRRTTARNAGLGLLFVGIALAGMVPLSGRLTRNLTELTQGVGRIAQGDYAARVPVKSRDEIGRLASAFNHMAADVEQHQRSAVEQERIRRELELGRRIQSDMLPRTPLHFGLTEVKGVSVPAREVGGDFFNYFALDSGLVALLVGDVSGKGVGAALLMANIQASLRTRFALGQGLSAIAEAIDWDIEANTPGPVYATLFIAIFDPATRVMRYVNAGHNPQLVRRSDGGLERMSSTGMPVGLLAGHGYSEREVRLAPGDLLFFYTDGCVEMENEAGDMFGSERLEALVAASGRGSADEVLVAVEQAISAFRGGRDLFDDATMMAVTVG